MSPATVDNLHYWRTAVSLLLGLLRPDAGAVSLFGTGPTDIRAKVRAGAMLQISGVPATLTVREHLTSFASYYPNPLGVGEAIERTALSEVADRQYGKLSGGQKQRLHFALAMIGNPDLLFLDEPTTGLDVASRRDFWLQVRSFLAGGRTVVLTTHYLEEADALADRIVVLDHGRILAEGTPAAIAQRLGLSDGTVRNYLCEAIGKLGAGNRVEAARLARERGWL